jgi:ABC-2 type transport system ATP-binding protein
MVERHQQTPRQAKKKGTRMTVDKLQGVMQSTLQGSVPLALSIDGATKRYESGFTLEDVTFDLPAGYIMGLIGPNGAGKSTLIKLILNMIRRDAGSISVLGMDNIRSEEAIKEQLGIVFDTHYFIEAWTVRKAGQAMAPMYPTWNQQAFDSYLRRFGLDERKKVKELSRGMQMKLMLAVALSHDAKLLILDEPTSGLDVLGRDELMDILHEYIEDGARSVLFSTHITDDLEHAADFIAYITGGRLYYSGPKDEFEDSFRLVKGGPEQLDAIAGQTLGIHRYETGFDALLPMSAAKKLQSNDMNLAIEPVLIDDIVRLTNAKEETR